MSSRQIRHTKERICKLRDASEEIFQNVADLQRDGNLKEMKTNGR